MIERSQPVWGALGTDCDSGAKLVIVHSPSCSPRRYQSPAWHFSTATVAFLPYAMGGYGHRRELQRVVFRHRFTVNSAWQC
jgi:hypothetical protein